MRLSDKQAQVLVLVLRDSLALVDGGTIFSIDQQQRTTLLGEIMNQQSPEVREVGPSEAENLSALGFAKGDEVKV